MKPRRVLGFMECLCLDGCDVPWGIGSPGSAPGIGSQMSCTKRKWGGKHSQHLAGKRSSAVSGYSASRGGSWRERLCFPLNA